MRLSVWCGWLVLAAGLARVGSAQTPPPATAQGVLVEMAAQASVIFTGRVLAIDRQDAAGYVDVRFRIEQAVRGCVGKKIYVLREWAGLWTGQAERYSVGQRRLMLLTARGPSGMSAPVNGMDGAIPLLAEMQPPVMDRSGAVPADLATAAVEPMVDLRWVQVKALRQAAPRQGGAASSDWIGPVKQLYAPGLVSVSTGLSTVLGWLGGGNAGTSHAE